MKTKDGRAKGHPVSRSWGWLGSMRGERPSYKKKGTGSTRKTYIPCEPLRQKRNVIVSVLNVDKVMTLRHFLFWVRRKGVYFLRLLESPLDQFFSYGPIGPSLYRRLQLGDSPIEVSESRKEISCLYITRENCTVHDRTHEFYVFTHADCF